MIFRLLVAGIILGHFTIRKKSGDKLYCIITTIAFTFIAGCRGQYVGTDTPRYVYNFDRAKPITFEIFQNILEEKEPLYFALQAVVRSFTDSYTVLFVIIAAFYNYCTSRLIYKYSKNMTLSYLLFLSMGYFYFSMSGVRATIAMGFIYLATDALIEKKYIKLIIYFFLSCTAHVTSLFWGITLLISLIPLGYTYIAVMGFVSVVIYFYGGRIISPLTEYIWSDTRVFKENSAGTFSTLILLIIIVICVLIVYKRLFQNGKGKSNKVLLNSGIALNLYADELFYKMLLFSIPIQLMVMHNGNAFRIAMMYHFTCMLLVPNTLANLQNKYDRTRTTGTVVVGALVLVQFFVFTYGASRIIPFRFFWE